MTRLRLTERATASFWKRVAKSDGCWLWTAGVGKNGYGLLQAGDVRCKAHRYSYVLHTGRPIRVDMAVCHTCDTPTCVNPDHLWLGTLADNNYDKQRKGRQHTQFTGVCPKGHTIAGENLFIRPESGARGCRTCQRERWRKGWERRKERANQARRVRAQ